MLSYLIQNATCEYIFILLEASLCLWQHIATNDCNAFHVTLQWFTGTTFHVNTYMICVEDEEQNNQSDCCQVKENGENQEAWNKQRETPKGE